MLGVFNPSGITYTITTKVFPENESNWTQLS